jgi:hypothetical protein
MPPPAPELPLLPPPRPAGLPPACPPPPPVPPSGPPEWLDPQDEMAQHSQTAKQAPSVFTVVIVLALLPRASIERPRSRMLRSIVLTARMTSFTKVHERGITQAPKRLAQACSTQNPQASQSLSVAHFLAVHPPMVAVVRQTKLIGQPVWLHGFSAQPWTSAPRTPTAH